MGSGDFNFDDSELRDFSDNIGKWPGTAMERGRKQLETEARNLRSRIVKERLSGQDLLSRSGRLKNAGGSNAVISGNQIVGTVSFTAVYARIQEEGGVITPKKRFLTIPLTAAMTDRGVARGPITSFPDITFERITSPIVDSFSGHEIPAGALVAFQNARKGADRGSKKKQAFGYDRGMMFGKRYDRIAENVRTGSLIPLFWLVRHVTIKGKHFAGSQLRHDAQRIGEAVKNAMGQALKVKV